MKNDEDAWVIPDWLRWLLVLPAVVLVTLATTLAVNVVVQLLRSDDGSLSLIRFIPATTAQRLVQSLVLPAASILAGAVVAPNRRLQVAVGLFVLSLLVIGGVSTVLLLRAPGLELLASVALIVISSFWGIYAVYKREYPALVASTHKTLPIAAEPTVPTDDDDDIWTMYTKLVSEFPRDFMRGSFGDKIGVGIIFVLNLPYIVVMLMFGFLVGGFVRIVPKGIQDWIDRPATPQSCRCATH
ncbi:MAG TPA: hypothetical protein VI056_05585 [Candidatus Limnocylindria bacterium]